MKCEHSNGQFNCNTCNQTKSVIALVDRKPPADPLGSFYATIRDAARFTDGITLAERIAVLDVVRAELVASFQSQIDAD